MKPSLLSYVGKGLILCEYFNVYHDDRFLADCDAAGLVASQPQKHQIHPIFHPTRYDVAPHTENFIPPAVKTMYKLILQHALDDTRVRITYGHVGAHGVLYCSALVVDIQEGVQKVGHGIVSQKEQENFIERLQFIRGNR